MSVYSVRGSVWEDVMTRSAEIIKKILKNRNIVSDEDVEEFLSPRPQCTYDPFLFEDMKDAVELTLRCIDEGEKICIYGDYDADGVTSVSVLLTVLGELTDNLTYYIPSRFTEGYGVNMKAVDELFRQGVRLLITVDCGSTSDDEIKHACDLGMNVIVTDHHNASHKPQGALFINPKFDKAYPYSNLAGCGVAYKFAQAVMRTADLPKKVITEILDIVAIGTVGDVVKLDGENRTLVKYGLNIVKRENRPGLKALAERISLDIQNINSGNIAFGIAPNLNAAGRISHAGMGVELLIADDDKKAREYADAIADCNYKRRSLQEKTFTECVGIVERDLYFDNFLIIEAEDVHEGVAGIVAGKIRDRYRKPVIIIMPTENGETGSCIMKGTGRTAGSVDLYETLKICEDLFEKFGGHRSACGFSLKKENIPELRRRILAEIERQLSVDETLLTEELEIDMELSGADITVELCEELGKLEPYGCGNPQPVFVLRDVEIGNVFYMGTEKQHVKFKALAGDGYPVQCLLFNEGESFRKMFSESRRYTLAGNVQENTWQGVTTAQFTVIEIN